MLEFYSGATGPSGRFTEGFSLRRLHPVRAALEEHALGEARSTPLIMGIGNSKLDGRGGHSNLRIRLPILVNKIKVASG